MSFYLEEEVEIKFSFNYSELAQRVVDFCLDYAKFPYEAEVNLTLTDNEGIHVINKEYREIDRPTDVLSFPMLEYEVPGDFSFLEANLDAFAQKLKDCGFLRDLSDATSIVENPYEREEVTV